MSTSRLSADAARTVDAETFRTGILRNTKGEPIAVAMHLTFRDRSVQGLVVLFSLAAMPAIIDQLTRCTADAQPPENGGSC